MSQADPQNARLLERLAAEQDERRRLGELLHDGPVQHLSAVSQMLDAAVDAVDAGDTARAREIVRRALGVSREASADLREIVQGLEPTGLQAGGFARSVSELAARIGQRRGIAFDLDLSGSDTLGELASVGLYQIVREAVDHAIRRGPPSTIRIGVDDRGPAGLVLAIADDGAGERRRAVVEGLQERAESLNATLAVEAHEPAGTIVRVLIPPASAAR